MKRTSKVLTVTGAGLIMAFLIMNIAPAESQQSDISLLPRPIEDMAAKPTLSLPSDVPDVANDVKMRTATDKTIYTNEETATIKLVLENNGDEPIITTHLRIGYQIIPVDGSPG